VANRPQGPFGDARQLPCGGIDPAVFIDDDGQAYFYWGQFAAHGAKLKRNMVEFEDGSVVHDLLTEQTHHFHEGSSPLGPFTHRGVIIDNAACDSKSWNNHGSIEQVNGRWYVFYHRASRGTRQWRRLCVEPIELTMRARYARYR
jgi:arabinoxylan arabinofuranohydrolase